jgi:O-antigen/teichoic acid export membrane protein
MTSHRMRATLGSIVTGGALQLTVAASGIIAARLLGVADRGRLALLWAVALVVAQLSTLGLPAAITYAVAGGTEPNLVIARIRRVIPFQLALSPPLTAAIGYLALRDHSHAVLASIALAVVVPPMLALLLFGLAVAQGQHRYRVVQLHRLAQPALYVVGLAALALLGGGTLPAVSAVWAASMVVGGLWAWRQGLGRWWPQEAPAPTVAGDGPRTTSALLRFGRRSFFGAYGFTEHLMLDLLLIGVLLPASRFGLYSAGWALANLPRFVGQSVGFVGYPEVARAEREGRAGDAALRRFLLLGLAVLLPVVAGLALLMSWLLPLLFGGAFRGAVPVAQLLVIAALPQALRRIGSEGLRGLGSSVPAAVAEIVFVVVFLATAIPMAHAGGATGAGRATLIASVAGALALPLLEVSRRRGWLHSAAPVAVAITDTQPTPGI